MIKQSNKIGLGTVQFGIDYGISNSQGKVPLQEVEKILQVARENNVRIIDSAIAYGDAHKVLSNFDLSSFDIVTKFLNVTSENIKSDLKKELKKMNIDHFYGVLAHRPTEVFEDVQIWKVLKSMKAEGLIRKIGFSFGDVQEIDFCIKNDLIPDLIQVPFNILDNRFKDSIKKLKALGCEIHTRSTFLQGLFFMDPNLMSDFFEPVKPIIKSIQSKTNNLAGSLLSTIAADDLIDHIIIGVTSAKQFENNLHSVGNSIIFNDIEPLQNEQILNPANWPK